MAEKILPPIVDGLAQFFGGIVNIDVTVPDGADGGNIKTVQ
jgi:hypothetical protein